MYLVREKLNGSLVGIFNAASTASLLLAVDEAADPFQCEFFCTVPGQGVLLSGVAVHTVMDHGFPFPVVTTSAEAAVALNEPLASERIVDTAAWRAFTREDFSTAFNVPLHTLDDPAVREMLWIDLGIAIPE